MHNSYFFEKKTASRHIINVGSTTPALLGAFILVGLTILSLAGCGGGGGGGSQAVTPPADEMIITPDDGTPSVPDHSFTPAGATPVVSGETMEGSLDSPDDVDYFRLELTEPGTILATINAEPGVEIAVVDGNGNVLATAVTASDATVGVTVSEKGTFFLRVLHEGLAEVGPKLYRVGAFVAKRIGAVINILRGIPTISLLGAVEVSLDLREYFEAPEGGMATYEVRASSGLLNLRVEQSALKISTLAPELAGPVTVTVCAELQHLQVIRPNVLLPGSFPLFLIGQTFKSRTCLEFTVRGEQLPRQIEGTELSVSVAQGGEVMITLTDYIEDPEGGALTFAHGSLPSGFGVTTDGAIWTLATQATVEPGVYPITVTATDGDGQSADFPFQVTVEEAGPRQIEGTDLSVSVEPGGEIMLRLTDYIEDPLGGPLTFALGSLPVGFGVNFGETPGPTWTIRTDATVEPGVYPITVTATDGDGQSEDFLFLVVVTEECRPHPSLFNNNGHRGSYVGECRAGLSHGQGTWMADRLYYNGEWHDGLAHGQGTGIEYFYAGRPAHRWEGEWREGQQHGQGSDTQYSQRGTGIVTGHSEGEYRDNDLWNGTSVSCSGGYRFAYIYVNGSVTALNDRGNGSKIDEIIANFSADFERFCS